MTTPHKQTYAELQAAAERAEKATVSDAQLLALQTQIAELAAQLAALKTAEAPKGEPSPTTPAKDDVPGYFFRNPRTGILTKVPATNEDTVRRCIRESHRLEDDPRVSGAPIFGEPWMKGDELGLGPTASIQRTN